MGMEKDRLREDLERLHQELSRSESVDAASRGLLVDLLHDIEAVLERSEDETGESGDSLIQRLRETTGHFEESHPTLTELVGRIADVLSRLGI
jgi:hypothetical protein